ncbi:MAG: rod shape-determining protein RodA [Oscillospiraceae bacterium]|nr:rod shape-determining protein RodA [Oscillospiraceae bacterium]
MFKRLFSGIDGWLVFMVCVAAGIGLLAVASSTAGFDSAMRFTLIQGGAFFIGALLAIFLLVIDYENLSYYWKWMYGALIVLLLGVLFFGGDDGSGTNRWIRIGGFGFQPSEIVKILFIFALAKFISERSADINHLRNVLIAAGLLVVPVVLIAMQPDMGTAISFIFIFVAMVWIIGLSWKYFAWAAAGLAAILPMVYFFILRDYQKLRILEFFNPGSNPTGSSYQIMQSKIAIGSGQIWGNGLFRGLQTQGGLLPAKHTDFIFGVVGEEMGFVGAMVLVAVLLGIVWRCFALSKRCDSGFSQMICVGVGALLGFHVFENLLMVVGLAPVTGIPLPFVSYGGTSMLASMVAVGLVLAASRQRRRN